MWLFLDKEPRKKIEAFSYALEKYFLDSWDLSRYVPDKIARQPVKKSYSLEDCFKSKGQLQDQKLIVGQKFLEKPVIRMAFLNKDIWADFTIENTNENYIQVDSLFLPVFGYKIENYPYQQQLKSRHY